MSMPKVKYEQPSEDLSEVFQESGELTPAFAERWDTRLGFYMDHVPTDLLEEEVDSLRAVSRRDILFSDMLERGTTPDEDFTAQYRTLLETLAETGYPELRNIPEGKMLRIRLHRGDLIPLTETRDKTKDEATQKGLAAIHATPEDDSILVLPTVAPKYDDATKTWLPVPLSSSFTAYLIPPGQELVVDIEDPNYPGDEEIQADHRRNHIM